MASDTLIEEWRSVEGWPYEVSSLGRVRRSTMGAPLTNTSPGRIRTPYLERSGYLRVNLSRGADRRKHWVHRLVVEAFIGPPPNPLCQVAHIDGCPLNNVLANLRWATPKENSEDKRRHGTMARGTAINTNKLSRHDVMALRHLRKTQLTTHRGLAERFGISKRQVVRILNGLSWSWVGSS